MTWCLSVLISNRNVRIDGACLDVKSTFDLQSSQERSYLLCDAGTEAIAIVIGRRAAAIVRILLLLFDKKLFLRHDVTISIQIEIFPHVRTFLTSPEIAPSSHSCTWRCLCCASVIYSNIDAEASFFTLTVTFI